MACGVHIIYSDVLFATRSEDDAHIWRFLVGRSFVCAFRCREFASFTLPQNKCVERIGVWWLVKVNVNSVLFLIEMITAWELSF